MASEALLRWLLDGGVATGLAVLLVLALRLPLRRAFGARVAYAAWALVPLALVAALLPRPRLPPQVDSVLSQVVFTIHPGALAVAADASTGPVLQAQPAWPLLLVLAWTAGLLLLVARFAVQQWRFVAGLGPLRRRADGTWFAAAGCGPALVGAWKPRIVLPLDFDDRYPVPQAALIIAHERAHLQRGDAIANVVATALRCLLWFNPLLHLAAPRFRLDQELACDATVLAHHPDARRSYADAILNTQLAAPGLPAGCHWHWQSSQSLKERILMLKRNQPGTRRRRLGATVLCIVLAGSSYAAWALRPAADSGPVHPVAVQAASTAAGSIPLPAGPVGPDQAPGSQAAGQSDDVVKRTLSLEADNLPVGTVAQMVADELGLQFERTEGLDFDKPIVLKFEQVSAETMLLIMGGEIGARHEVAGNTLRFVPVAD